MFVDLVGKLPLTPRIQVTQTQADGLFVPSHQSGPKKQIIDDVACVFFFVLFCFNKNGNNRPVKPGYKSDTGTPPSTSTRPARVGLPPI